MRIPSLLTLCAGLVLRPSSLPAQAPGVPIESAAPLNQNRALLDKLAALRDTGRALDTAAIKAALQKPAPAAITLPPCRSTPLRPAEVWQESRVAFARFHIATGTKKETEAAAAAARLADESLKDNGPLLNETAWKLITRFPAPQPDTLAAAEKMARRSVDLQEHRNPASLDTLARVCFLQAKKDEALRLQEEAVNLSDGTMKAALEKTLTDYRAGKLPEIKEE